MVKKDSTGTLIEIVKLGAIIIFGFIVIRGIIEALA